METTLERYEQIKATMPSITKSSALANFLKVSCLVTAIALVLVSAGVFVSAEYIIHRFFWSPDQFTEMQKVKDLDMGRLFYFTEMVLIAIPLLASVPFWIIFIFSKKILRRNRYINSINRFIESSITRELHMSDHQVY